MSDYNPNLFVSIQTESLTKTQFRVCVVVSLHKRRRKDFNEMPGMSMICIHDDSAGSQPIIEDSKESRGERVTDKLADLRSDVFVPNYNICLESQIVRRNFPHLQGQYSFPFSWTIRTNFAGNHPFVPLLSCPIQQFSSLSDTIVMISFFLKLNSSWSFPWKSIRALAYRKPLITIFFH